MIQIECGAKLRECASVLTCRKFSTEWNPSSCDHRLCTIAMVPAVGVAYAARACCCYCCCCCLFKNLSFYSSAYGECVYADTCVAHCNTEREITNPLLFSDFFVLRFVYPHPKIWCLTVLCMRTACVSECAVPCTELKIRSNDRIKDEIVRNTCTTRAVLNCLLPAVPVCMCAFVDMHTHDSGPSKLWLFFSRIFYPSFVLCTITHIIPLHRRFVRYGIASHAVVAAAAASRSLCMHEPSISTLSVCYYTVYHCAVFMCYVRICYG